MVDNASITPGSGLSIAADDIGGVLYQRVKLIFGGDGSNSGDVSGINGLPIQGTQPAVASTAWTSATALNAAASISVNGLNTVTVAVVATTTLTAGALTFEASPDGTNWFPIAMARIDSGGIETVYALVPSVSRAWSTSVDGFTNFRVRLSTAIVGTATVTVLIGAQTFAIEPIVSAVPNDGQKPTYSSVAQSAVATAFPIAYIQGSATKIIRVTRVAVSGTQTTGGALNMDLARFSTAPVGGTAAATTITKHDTSSPAATAVVQQYSVAPTGTGTLVGSIRRQVLWVPATTAEPARAEWTFGDRPAQALVLRGTGDFLALWPAAAAGASWRCDFEWTEE